MEDLTSSILEFQANLMSLAYRRKTSPVDLASLSVQKALDTIWLAARGPLVEARRHKRNAQSNSTVRSGPWSDTGEGSSNDRYGRIGDKWVSLGFESENLRSEFARVGLLGLDCLVSLADNQNNIPINPNRP